MFSYFPFFFSFLSSLLLFSLFLLFYSYAFIHSQPFHFHLLNFITAISNSFHFTSFISSFVLALSADGLLNSHIEYSRFIYNISSFLFFLLLRFWFAFLFVILAFIWYAFIHNYKYSRIAAWLNDLVCTSVWISKFPRYP